MDYLWSPWRYRYVSQAAPGNGCIFCEKPQQADHDALIVCRSAHCYVILNRFPYTSGHVMVVPYVHIATLEEASSDVLRELMELTALTTRHLRSVYQPKGINLGMNLGECAGAGVAGHLHMHVVPRWPGDVNFMTVVGETRVLPEDLSTTYDRLRKAFSSDA
ncbi:MAG: HIT domain-containing protein [Bryobacteraceae bacterium]|nr:HIT domain-containing protein [Bryobacteraceae bacterium]MDW8377681.1 HIT domain-containing protein [Bryobacterales bacterium]